MRSSDRVHNGPCPSVRDSDRYRRHRAQILTGCAVAIAVCSTAWAQDAPVGFVRSAKPRDVPRVELIAIKQAKPSRDFSVEFLSVPLFVGDRVTLIRRDGELVLGMVDGDVVLTESNPDFVVPEPSQSGSRWLVEFFQKVFKKPPRRPSIEAMPQAGARFDPFYAGDSGARLDPIYAGGSGSMTVDMRTLGFEGKWAAKPEDSFVVAGTRSFEIFWRQGKPPYIVALDTPGERLKILGDTTEQRFTSSPLEIHPGFVSLNVLDANGDLVYRTRFTSIPKTGLPHCPIAKWANATPEEQAVCLEWLATQDPRWTFEAVQSRRPIWSDGKR